MGTRQPGRERLEQALLALLVDAPLRDITVTQLCHAAHVSRSTFYAHHPNVEELFRSLVRQLIFDTSSMRTQLRCAECVADARRPLCETIRNSEEHQGLVHDEAFLPVFLDLCRSEFPEDALGPYLDACPDKQCAQALHSFQIMGCVAAANAVGAYDDWAPVKVAVDAFIRGGLNAVRQTCNTGQAQRG